MSRLDNIADDDDSPTDTYAAYSYLGASTLIKVEYPGVTSGGNALALTYGTSADSYAGFDRFGRVVDQKWRFGTAGTVADHYTYAYDRTSNRLYRQNELENTLSELYHANGPTGAYDGLDRLTDFRRGTLSDSTPTDGILDKIDTTVSRVQAWTLDSVGNWPTYKDDADGTGWDLDQARAHNKANEIEDTVNQPPDDISGTPNWVDPAYDAAGNMTAGPKPGAETATTSNYTYDAWNRLVKVADGETTTAEYRYDGQHRRIRKYTAPSGDNWTVREYYYNESWQVLEVRKATKTRTGGAEPALANMLHKQYIWGADYIDSPVVRFRDSSETPDGVLNETLYYTHDAQFNTTALVTPAGAVAERYMYDPYGKVTVLNGASGADGDGAVTEWAADSVNASDWDNEILYCGYRHDPETGLYQVRRRYLHSTLGRWASRDPIGYRDGRNLYQCAQSNPINGIDPQGLKNIRWYPSGTIQDENVTWTYSFDATFHVFKCRLGFRAKVQLYAEGNQKDKVRTQIKQLIPSWDQAVKSHFNRWKLMPKDLSRCWVCCNGIDLTFRVEFVDSWTWTDDQEVAVRLDVGRSNMRKWHLGSLGISSPPYKTVVHEVAHMFGLKDEYRDTVYYPTKVEPADKFTSIMYDSGMLGTDIRRRHIEDIVYNVAKIQHELPCQYEVKRR